MNKWVEKWVEGQEFRWTEGQTDKSGKKGGKKEEREGMRETERGKDIDWEAENTGKARSE